MTQKEPLIKIGVVGLGAIGSVVARALIAGISGYQWIGGCDVDEDSAAQKIGCAKDQINFLSQDDLIQKCDWIVEALPAKQARELDLKVLEHGKILVAISSAALVTYPEILTAAQSKGRILVASGAIAGLDGIAALAVQGIKALQIHTTKPPKSFAGAPYITDNQINLESITQSQVIFEGNAKQAAAGFPANVNVAATLALVSKMNADDIFVKITADPATSCNTHEIKVDGGDSQLTFRIENRPDPQNPKSSLLTALSLIALLKRQTESIAA